MDKSVSSYGLIYISGRGGVGKSTIAEKFSRDLGFTLIALDELIRQEFDSDFKLYNKGKHLNQHKVSTQQNQGRFIQRIRDLITLHKFCVIEGMIRSNEIIQEIFHGYAFTFCYVKPSNIDAYLQNIRKRFIESPDNYGRLGFLRRYDESHQACHQSIGLKDFKINGIDGLVIQQVIVESGKAEIEESERFCQQYQQEFQVIILIN